MITSSTPPTPSSAFTVGGEVAGQLDAFTANGPESAQRERHRVCARPQIDDAESAGVVGHDAARLLDERRARGFDGHTGQHARRSRRSPFRRSSAPQPTRGRSITSAIAQREVSRSIESLKSLHRRCRKVAKTTTQFEALSSDFRPLRNGPWLTRSVPVIHDSSHTACEARAVGAYTQ